MNKNKFLYVAALFGMMVLVSCSSHDSAKNVTVTSEQSGAESQAASDIVSKPLTLLQSNDGWSYGAAGAKGFYFVSAAVRSDDSTSLMYCDYDTMQQILLCSQPNCAHNTAACNGYLPYSAGGIVPEIVGQNLVLFYPGNVHAEENATLPRIETMGLDGSDRTETITFAATKSFCAQWSQTGILFMPVCGKPPTTQWKAFWYASTQLPEPAKRCFPWTAHGSKAL